MVPENVTGVQGVFQYLAREKANVSSPLNAQGVSQIVQCFDGNVIGLSRSKSMVHYLVCLKLERD